MSAARIALPLLALLGVAVAAPSASPRQSAAPEVVLVGRSVRPPGALVWIGGPNRLAPARLVRGAESPALSHDARSLAYAVRRGRLLDVRVAPAGGGVGRVVARVGGARVALAFSPDD